MNVLLHIPLASKRMGGGAIAMWRVGGVLRAKEHALRVTATKRTGRKVRGLRVGPLTRPDLRWADVMLTAAGDDVADARRSARLAGLPVVAFVHSAAMPAWAIGADSRPDLVVWGSAALEERARAKGCTFGGPSMVLWPPVDADSVRTTPGDAVTVVNLIPEKGAHLFWDICRRMPDVPFLGSRGGWGRKRHVIPSPLPHNAAVMDFVADVRKVYRRTRVLLYMRGPDAGPDWLNGIGLAALEAAVSGIPTVAHPGPGLVEGLGDAGTWVDSDDPAEWAAAIRRVLDPAVYPERSEAARRRADATLHPGRDVDALLSAVAGLRGEVAE